MRFKIFTILLLVLSSFLAYSQQETIETLDEIIEEIASNTDYELDYTTLFQSLEEYYYNPIDLNSAKESDLKNLMFLTEFQIFSLIKYRQKFGAYVSLYELQFVDGIDDLTLKRILPFVNIQETKTAEVKDLKRLFTYGKHTGIIRYQRLIQEKSGYKEIPDSVLAVNPNKSRYLGSPDKIYYRHNYQYKDKMFYGITAEKDDGEQFFKGAQKYGFDFYSAHFQLNRIGVFQKIILGDYIAQFGQGLTMWSGMSFGKTSSSTNIIKNSRGINKYSSVNESAFLRGQAASIEFGKFNFTEFVSYKSLDAGVDTTENIEFESEEHVISSFLETGYHRTPNEIAKRKTIQEFIAGANMNWKEKNFKIGATGVYYTFSSPLGERNEAYRYFDFVGTQNANFGIDYLITIPKVNIFGETSMSSNLGYASVNGAVINFVPEFNMSVLHRYLRADYQALYAQPFSEGNKPYNESGFFVGAEFYPIKKWKIDAYFDSWKYPWLRFGVGAPSWGNEYLVQVAHFPQRNLELYLRVKYKTKQKNDPEIITGIKPLVDYSSSRYRIQLNYTPNSAWKFKSRIELSRYYMNTPSWGYLVYQDIDYKPENIALKFNFRIAVFETDTYDARLYAYEPDVLYGFSVPAYYGKGSRLVFVVKYTLNRHFDFWFRIANTYYADKQNLGSGLDAIEGNNRTDVKIQLRYKF
ncbi:MAG: helix-hairpin-helix domain-containing protein [Bacteroidales bacterium]|jgi:hypothetical protein|nr:helix-hairpin-helix domain-containing protein [Bacteroidales bacterium]MCK9498871.1 helix-hairpin-helix domain-containing protein [Bacteroidales bacterium]